MSDLTFTTDKRLVIRDCSDDLVQLTGKVRSEIVGKKYHAVFPRLIVRDRCALGEVMEKDRTVSLKSYTFQCLQGSWQAHVKIAPHHNGKGEVKGSLVTIQPLTVCPLASKLNQSQRLIETGKVAAMFAHGVRNPLNAIKGAVVYLRDTYTNEQPIQEFARRYACAQLFFYILQYPSLKVNIKTLHRKTKD